MARNIQRSPPGRDALAIGKGGGDEANDPAMRESAFKRAATVMVDLIDEGRRGVPRTCHEGILDRIGLWAALSRV